LANKRERGSKGNNFLTRSSTSNRTQHGLYEYICRKCRHKFDEVLTIKEHETKKPQCPKCQSSDLEKVIEPFFAKTASKTRGY
jgi:putative FmdB family regulatory protein